MVLSRPQRLRVVVQAILDDRQVLEIAEERRNADHHDCPVYGGDVGDLALSAMDVDVVQHAQRQQRVMQDHRRQHPRIGIVFI